MNDELIKQHPFYKHADEVHDLCKDLLDKTPVNYFCLARTYPDGNYGGLMTDKRWAYHYLKNDFHQIGFELQLIEEAFKKSNLHFWNLTDIVPTNADAQLFYKSAIDFKRGSGVIILDPYPDYIGVALFTTNHDPYSSDPYLINNTAMLKRFILYFKEKIHENKKLQEAYQHTNINTLKAISPAQFHAEPNLKITIKKYYLDGQFQKISFSQREAECLKYLGQRKTAKEIASILKLSPRTIETHIEKIKHKTGCKSLQDLMRNLENCTLLDGIE